MTEKVNSADLGFEKEIFKAADKLRGNIDAAEYKNIVLGLIFLKYISDSFEERYNELKEEGDGFEEDRDEYLAENIFFVPEKARWVYIAKHATEPEIGQVIDQGMILIEEENDRLRGILPKNYARPELDKRRLGEVVDLFNNLKLKEHGNSKDILGRTYEYAIAQFASLEGKNAGEFYTPSSIVRTLVEILEPYEGRVYDPCCGAGGMFVQSAEFVERHQGRINELSIYGQEANANTWKLAQMNLAIHGIEGDLGQGAADTFYNNQHQSMRADYILANPPFNMSDWGGDKLAEDVRWQYGTPPEGNANFAWMQHMIYHLAPNGKMGLILANGSLSSGGKEGDIRSNIIKDDLVEAVISMPGKLFYSTGIPVSLWIINKNKKQKGKILFIDARSLGYMVSRAHRELSLEDIDSISNAYHDFVKGENVKRMGYAHDAALEEVEQNNFVLTPGRYVGLEEVEEDGIPFEEKMDNLTAELGELLNQSHKLEEEIREQLGGIGFDL
ncbi:type I restriction-modification system subunit M [Marinilactibacillus psychrotolerans]|uniref:site-specific DNA-methyltransferase (adenine-specific) n=1 Tax=Marinilactibacillus psychrotolerans TaxID=191770 RepID=A0AAV3WUM6_9LACT|nr:class I SAM-dependent DNA methyltransferase [Marinilactibacillus psychrotolerans]GEL66488.1 DNA methyltransferase [Marinilactibacillus psychrotolerans]GEQ35304.1 type I restriction-modification system DNA-methyltransferase subunit M [Marinilactibacillus psychrotolerans]SDC52991.1 type I restriction enzyme M protein [Marinilactibacillus psychrotolerans]